MLPSLAGLKFSKDSDSAFTVPRIMILNPGLPSKKGFKALAPGALSKQTNKKSREGFSV